MARTGESGWPVSRSNSWTTAVRLHSLAFEIASILRLFFAQSTRQPGGEQEAKKAKLSFAPDELISIEGCCDEVFEWAGFGGGFFHPHHLAETAKVYVHAMQVRERDDVLD